MEFSAALWAHGLMIWDDGVTRAPIVTVLSTEEMDVHRLCQLKQSVYKGETSDATKLLESCNKLKMSQPITRAVGDQDRDGLRPACLDKMAWKGNAALRKSAWIQLYKAVCTVNIAVSWVWVLFTPFKGRNGERNMKVCQLEIAPCGKIMLMFNYSSCYVPVNIKHREVKSSQSISSTCSL